MERKYNQFNLYIINFEVNDTILLIINLLLILIDVVVEHVCVLRCLRVEADVEVADAVLVRDTPGELK